MPRSWFAPAALAGAVVLAPQPSPAAPLTIAEGGRSRYRIVVPERAGAGVTRAAAELQRFLAQMSGARLPIVTDREPPQPYEIDLGSGSRLAARGVLLDTRRLGTEGYLLETVDTSVVIAGGEPRGTLYGVYGLLQDHLGCRWYTPAVSRIPRRRRLVVPHLSEERVPAFEYRHPDVFECNDPDWSARNRMNGSPRLTAEHGGGVAFGRGLGVHTFERLMPPSRNFTAHPDWFMVGADGKRQPDQLCCTSEGAIDALIAALRERMRSDPAQVFSVSQNDNDLYCECASCAALARAEGSQAGPLLYLVNRVAAAVAREFPDRSIETLAYAYSRRPPRTLRPAPNVIVRLCSFECCFSHPLEVCDGGRNAPFVADLRAWGRICRRLWVWNYEAAFAHYLLPFPNYHVWEPNIRLFARLGVRGVYTQDINVFAVGELNEMGAYVRARLLWDPSASAAAATGEFLRGVYGPAAPYLRRYLDLLSGIVVGRNLHMGIWETPDAQYLTTAVLAEADRLWDRAEAAAVGQPDVLARVRLSRISPDYAIVERARVSGEIATHTVDHARFTIGGPRPGLAARLARLRAGILRAGVRSMGEGRMPAPEYLASLDALLEPRSPRRLTPRAAAGPRSVLPGLKWSAYHGVWERLPDFGAMRPVRAGVASRVAIPGGMPPEGFGVRLQGYLRVPRDGVYALTLHSNDGSRLWIGGELVVDNDGAHLTRPRTGCVALRAGLHPLRIDYFQARRAMDLRLLIEGPGVPPGLVPEAMLVRSAR